MRYKIFAQIIVLSAIAASAFAWDGESFTMESREEVRRIAGEMKKGTGYFNIVGSILV